MHQHYYIYKPVGYLSQFIYNGKRQKRKKLLGVLHDFAAGTMSIGRLDEDSEGLLLLTTDGKLSEYVRSKKIEKEYYVQVDGIVDEAAIQKLCRGVEIGIKGEKYLTKNCQARLLPSPEQLPKRDKKIRDERHGPTSWLSITLREGKYRQVRKMTAAVGFPTLRLVRYRIGDVTIDGLGAGEVKEWEGLNYPIKKSEAS